MSFFDYACEKCKIVWEKDYPIGKAPKTTKCPKCSVKGERYYGTAPAIHFKGNDFWTTRNANRKANIKTNQEDGDRFMREAIELSKDRLAADRGEIYTRYNPTNELMKERGFKKLSNKEQSELNEKAKSKVGKLRNKVK